jgi:16S rRNA (cytidine1402-2'-O)-methyltransferase
VSGTLVLVPTPIGNLGDMTLRAIEVLKAAPHIVAEDTRHTRKLLTHFEIDGTKLSRLDANALEADRQRVIDWLRGGEDVAVVTDAGCPAVSDPGTALVRDAVASGIAVTALPGASAVTAAVGVSGLVDSSFQFLGFLPRTGQTRAVAVTDIASHEGPCVLFESPERMNTLLAELSESMPDRPMVVARELSKLHEEILRGTVSELAAAEREWLGEITVVLGPWEHRHEASEEDIDRRIDEELATGAHTRRVAEKVAAWSGKPRREIYARVLDRKK